MRREIRPLEDQFEAETVGRIRAAADRASALQMPDGVSRYYRSELVQLLEAGTLLGALHVAASLLEIAIRGAIVERASSASAGAADLEAALEARRDLGFSQLVGALCDVGLFDGDDGKRAVKFYQEVRIPVHHGLPNRFVAFHGDEWMLDFRKLVQVGGVMSSHEFEEIIENRTLDHVETVIDLLDRNIK